MLRQFEGALDIIVDIYLGDFRLVETAEVFQVAGNFRDLIEALQGISGQLFTFCY